jgi:hypothetical protein
MNAEIERIPVVVVAEALLRATVGRNKRQRIAPISGPKSAQCAAAYCALRSGREPCVVRPLWRGDAM